MKNKNNLFMLEKFKGFVFGFTFAVALVAVGVYAANTDALQKKWKAVWHGTDWIDAGRVVRSEELAENLEYLKSQIDELWKIVDNITSKSIADHIVEIGQLSENKENNLGNNWNWVVLEGVVVAGDAAAAGGHIVREANGTIKAAITSATGGRGVFMLNENYQCIWENDSWYSFCVKRENDNVIVKLGRGTRLIYVKLK